MIIETRDPLDNGDIIKSSFLVSNTFGEVEKQKLLKGTDITRIIFHDIVIAKDIIKIKKFIESNTLFNDTLIIFYNTIKKSERDAIAAEKFPDNFEFCYTFNGETTEITKRAKFDDYMNMYEYLDEFSETCLKNNLSPLESALLAYDKAKFLEYSLDGNANILTNVSDVILSGKAKCTGYSALYIALLSSVGIKAIDVELMIDSDPHARTVVNIDDEKYNIHGIYLCDPTFDSIIRKYDSTDPFLRKQTDINRTVLYNHFMKPISSMKTECYEAIPTGVLQILAAANLGELNELKDISDFMDVEMGNNSEKENKAIYNFEIEKLQGLDKSFDLIMNKSQNPSVISTDTLKKLLYVVKPIEYSGLTEKQMLKIINFIMNRYYEREISMFPNSQTANVMKLFKTIFNE